MLNVFKLPLEFFTQICKSNEYDIIRLYLKGSEIDQKTDTPVLVGVMFSYVNNDNYNAMIVGLNYDYAHKFNCYKQILSRQFLEQKLNCNQLDLAFTAELEKKIGVKPLDVFAYVQSKEHLKGSILEFL